MTDAALQLPDAWAHPETGRQIPGCTGVRKVAGQNVYTIEGESFLSTSTALRLSCWGNVSHVPPDRLAYGAARGSWVDQACQLYDAGALDWDATPWDQTLHGLPFRPRKLVEAYAEWVAGVTVLDTESLVVAHDCHTFGYRDRVIKHPTRGQVVVDIKTSKAITDREKLQIASYATNATDAMLLLQLTPKGAVEHWVPDWPAYRERFKRLALEATWWIEQQEGR